jgi:BirA family transcriptional regulator, biotin operon repressor / biotin---[acetyl-CoA-carboxylase] ligase
MNENEIRIALSELPLRGLRFYAQTGSTNDDAKAWAQAGAPDLSLVCAEEQTSGRGRGTRRWFTPPGAALAFSLVLRPKPGEEARLPLFSALGAVAVCHAVDMHGLHAEVKWPNDVLLGGRKFCGILAEAAWVSGKADYVILGIGVNISAGSIPPQEGLNFPATCLEKEAGRSIDRLPLLHGILSALLSWRPLLSSPSFLAGWESRLAFRGQPVGIVVEGRREQTGRLEGLESDGSLRLRSDNGEVFLVQFGEVYLRPLV